MVLHAMGILELLLGAFSVVVALVAIPLGASIGLLLAHLVSGELLRAVVIAYKKTSNPATEPGRSSSLVSRVSS
jgi:hypothetical protein